MAKYFWHAKVTGAAGEMHCHGPVAVQYDGTAVELA